MAAMEKAFALRPDDPGLNNNLGYFYADRGIHLDKAEKMVRKARAGTPKQVNVLDSVGWVFYKQGRFEEAGDIFQEILTLQATQAEKHPVLFDHAGDVYYRLDDREKAVELWKRAIETAKKQKPSNVEIRMILSQTPGKIQAAEQGRPPKLAPLAVPAKEGK